MNEQTEVTVSEFNWWRFSVIGFDSINAEHASRGNATFPIHVSISSCTSYLCEFPLHAITRPDNEKLVLIMTNLAVSIMVGAAWNYPPSTCDGKKFRKRRLNRPLQCYQCVAITCVSGLHSGGRDGARIFRRNNSSCRSNKRARWYNWKF